MLVMKDEIINLLEDYSSQKGGCLAEESVRRLFDNMLPLELRLIKAQEPTGRVFDIIQSIDCL